MKEKVKEKVISIIIPNFDINRLDEINANLTPLIPSGFCGKFILVGQNLKNQNLDENCVFIECDEKTSYNTQITQAFYHATGECVVVCDIESPRYVEYFQQILTSWLKGAKIVRLKKVKPTKFWDKFKQFFVDLKNKIYNIFLKLSGYTVDNLCVNSFQLFDKQVFNLIKAIPEKNAYLRNCSEFSYFNTVELQTDENIKLKNNKLNWSAKLIVSACMLGLFVTFFVLSFVLYPIAKQKAVNFTFISLMLLLNLTFLSGSIIFFFSALMDNKLGCVSSNAKNSIAPNNEAVNDQIQDNPTQTEDKSDKENKQAPLETDVEIVETTQQPKKENKNNTKTTNNKKKKQAKTSTKTKKE